mgnify:CR=1 FL=1
MPSVLPKMYEDDFERRYSSHATFTQLIPIDPLHASRKSVCRRLPAAALGGSADGTAKEGI